MNLTLKTVLENIETAESRLEKLYNSRTDLQHNQGIFWYQKAYAEILKLSGRYELHPTIIAGIVSAFSPMTGWDENLITANNWLYGQFEGEKGFLLAHKKVSATTDRKKKAQNILAVPTKNRTDKEIYIDVEYNFRFTVSGKPSKGFKTLNFFRNLNNPFSGNFVTLDRHAINCLFYPDSNEGIAASTESAYEKVSEIYRIFAEKVNILPHELQAIVWVVFKDLKHEANPKYNKLSEFRKGF